MLRKRPPLAVPSDRSRLISAVDASPALFPLKHLLAHAIVSGLWRDPFVSARIIAACAASDLPFAQLAFDASPRRSAFSYTTMIRAHSSGPAPSNSILIFSGMLRSGFYPDRFAFPFLLRASSRSLSPPSSFHALAHRHGLAGDPHVATSLLHSYASCGLIDSALKVFDEMPHRTEVTWSAVISCCARSKNKQQNGLSLFNQMFSAGARPNVDTLIASVSCCAAGAGLIANGKALHALSIRLLPSSSIAELGTSLITMYARTGSLKNALKVFDEIEAKDSSTLTAMIGGLAMHGRGEEAVAIFQKMVVGEDAIRPDSVAFTAVLHACSHAGLVDMGVKIFDELKTVHCIEARMEHYGAMVDLFGRSGRLEEAAMVAAAMPFAPNRIVWGSLMHACAVRGELAYGERLKTTFLKLGFFVGLSNVYAGACRWPEVVMVRDMMVEKGVWKEGAFSLLETLKG
ncbi:Pentatricopeptide repeat-containing protein [Platanthera zijinensis]|uniref:Pentatricopeptide repeat-containing protein n=1 Tax=Platanthera zijinensis TaxID=2320716 RepID=A0AAP0BNH8_9ASPA